MTLHVAIVGAGPAGFYAAEALSNHGEDVQVDLLDRLPTPYGLIRSGVAPDHQKTKNVARKYDQTAARDNVRYVGNVELGRDFTIDKLREIYDAVIIAFGAEGDRAMGIPGEDKEGVLGSFEFVGWYNGHPDFANAHPDLNTHAAVIVGNGNVALDCARLLVRTEEEMQSSDVAEDAGDKLFNSPVENVTVLGRRGPLEASFSIAEMREMADLQQGISLVRPDQIPTDMPDDMDPKLARAKKLNLDVLNGFRDNTADMARKSVQFEFFAQPVEVLGDDRVEGLRVERTRLVNGKATGTGETFDIPCGLVVTCIGYVCKPVDGIPMENGVIINDEGRIAPGLYCVGWAKRGPTGTIGTNRPDAQDVVKRLLADIPTGTNKPGGTALDELIANSNIRPITYEEWGFIDEAEMANADIHAPRRKFTSIPEMLSVVDEA